MAYTNGNGKLDSYKKVLGDLAFATLLAKGRSMALVANNSDEFVKLAGVTKYGPYKIDTVKGQCSCPRFSTTSTNAILKEAGLEHDVNLPTGCKHIDAVLHIEGLIDLHAYYEALQPMEQEVMRAGMQHEISQQTKRATDRAERKANATGVLSVTEVAAPVQVIRVIAKVGNDGKVFEFTYPSGGTGPKADFCFGGLSAPEALKAAEERFAVTHFTSFVTGGSAEWEAGLPTIVS